MKNVLTKHDDLDWSYVFSNAKLIEVPKISSIANFGKTRHMKYIAHVTGLGND